MIILYGIPNCNTVKKARNYLEEKSIDYQFHDFKKLGAPADKLQSWCDAFGWEKTVNRAGMTWRKLEDNVKESITDDASAIALMQEKTSVIKRPIVEIDDEPKLLGFKETEYDAIL
jgi:Spx/MgsR family transcriptional regulator